MEKTSELDLSRLNLKYIPSEISYLEHIDSLILEGNRLVEITGLNMLTNLKNLNLRYNQLTEIRGLKALAGLEILDLSSNRLTEIKGLEELISLTKLFLADNQLTEIKGLEALYDLETLTLDNNRLTEIKGLAELPNLKTLHLQYNGLTEIKGLKTLTMLDYLDLSCNRITRIGGLEALKSLETLILSNNDLIEIKGLESLPMLNSLDLRHNNIEHLDVTILDLGFEINLNTRIRRISRRIASSDSIGDSRRTLGAIKKNLYIYNNPLNSPPPEIIKQGDKAIRNYLQQLEKGTSSYLYEAKLLIIGESGAGKTTLAWKIAKGINAKPPKESDSTRGIDILNKTFNCIPAKSEKEIEFSMNIWDFGGQEIYHTTHQFFLTRRSLYVLITDGRKQNADLNYWCQVVELLGENSPMLVVENQKEGHLQSSLDLPLYKRRFENIVTPILRSNFVKKTGLKEVIWEITHRIQGLEGMGDRLPTSWYNVRKRIEKLSSKKDYIRIDDYADLCKEEGLDFEKAKSLSRDYLHPVGVLLHFQDKPVLREYVILNNTWATDAVYAILKSDEIVQEKQGRFSYKDVEKIYRNTKYEMRVDFILELMMKFEICYQIGKSENYIAPQLLPNEAPTYKLLKGKKIRMIYDYDFMPKGLINRLSVRTHQHIANEKWIWKKGIILQMGENQAEVIESYDQKKIEIIAVGDEPKEIMTEVVREMDELNATFDKIKVEKLVPCTCQECEENTVPHFFKYQKLIKRVKEKRKSTVECLESAEDINVYELLEGVLTDIPEFNTQRIFFSYSKHDKRLRDELEKHLAPLKRQNKVETFHDRDMLPGVDWHHIIIKEINKADIILLLVSADFMDTDYIMKKEVPIAMERREKGCVVIPVLIRPCHWEDMPFAEFLGVPDKGKAVVQYKNRDVAWTKVVKRIVGLMWGEG